MKRFSYKPAASETRLPRYRRHKASGNAVVTLDGRDFYLGPYGTRTSRAEYDKLIGQWLAAGRCLPGSDSHTELTIADLCRAYARWAKGYYRSPDGSPTSSLNRVVGTNRLLTRKHGRDPAAQFGPLALQALRFDMANSGLSRR